jgi:ketosteroid isomerase-like protein
MRTKLLSLFVLFFTLLTGMQSVYAQTADEAAVAQAVESLRKAMLVRDAKQYEALISENVSYGHSAGRIENKQEFIAVNLKNKSVMKSLTFTDQTIKVTGDKAIVRNTYNGVSELDGKTNTTKIGVLLVWTKEGDAWRLYGRQAYRF